MRMREEGTGTQHPAPQHPAPQRPTNVQECPSPPGQRMGDGGCGGNRCFLAGLGSGGRRREEGASELAPREPLAMCRGSVPRLSSHFRSETTASPFPSAPAAAVRHRTPRCRPPRARSCGWAVLAGTDPQGRGAREGRTPKKTKNAIKQLPPDIYGLTGFIKFAPCPVPLRFFFL